MELSNDHALKDYVTLIAELNSFVFGDTTILDGKRKESKPLFSQLIERRGVIGGHERYDHNNGHFGFGGKDANSDKNEKEVDSRSHCHADDIVKGEGGGGGESFNMRRAKTDLTELTVARSRLPIFR